MVVERPKPVIEPEDEFRWPCGFCHKCYKSQQEFDDHKTAKHAKARLSMDHKDEHFYGKSDGPYHIDKSLINLHHEVDTTLTEKISANPKVLNSRAPQVQANFWGIYDLDARETVHGKLLHNRREVASVTKIMTAYAVIEVARKYKLDLPTLQVKIDAECAKVIGTSARLREGDILTAEQLLYGLMLPSGSGGCSGTTHARAVGESAGWRGVRWRGVKRTTMKRESGSRSR